MVYYTHTENYKGGINNLYVASYYQNGYTLATGTSIKGMKQAMKNCNNNYHRISKKILGF